ncbi:unnamed protein product [Mytilus edulis]|uniref:Uncharacterized protein n=1 Tax=Mytilus edulis TaxID=6550 RepID=A0A8S3RAM9_MYTED|nr:unnamed protein product [Mytilus edulis]
MASTVSGSTAFTFQADPDTGTFKRRFGDVSNFFFDSENGKVLGKTFQQWFTTTDEHGITSFRIYFSDVDDKTVKEINVETKVVKRLADKQKFSIDDAISRLADIDDFLCLCDIEIKTMTSEKHALQGPDGANSMQTKHDISQLITALKSLRDVVNETEPLFQAKFSLKIKYIHNHC